MARPKKAATKKTTRKATTKRIPGHDEVTGTNFRPAQFRENEDGEVTE
jgi:hypothetical protein